MPRSADRSTVAPARHSSLGRSVIRQSLKPELDSLYESFNVADSATDPVQVLRRYDHPADREIVAFLASGLAFGRVASVLASIERVLVAMAPSPAAFVREFRAARDGRCLQPLVHRWTRGPDLVALILILRHMLRTAGSLEGFFAAGHDASASDITGGLESFTTRARSVNVAPAYGGSRAGASRCPLLLSPAVSRKRLQASQPVPALDGPPRLGGPRRLDERPPGAAGGPARHPHHPCRPLPAADEADQPRMEDGRGDHRAGCVRSIPWIRCATTSPCVTSG